MLSVSTPPNGSGTRPVASRSQQRAEQQRRQQEKTRRRRQRLLPVLGAVIVTFGVLIWYVTKGSSTTSTAPSTTQPTVTTTTVPLYVPPPIKPTVSSPTSGEGQWVAKDTWLPGAPAVLTTTWRPEPNNLNVIAYGTWMRTSSTQLSLYPGYKGPGPTTLDRGPQQVPTSARPNLVATFNSGFYEADAAGGFYAHGTLYNPMINGLATVVTYANGTANIITWQAGPTPPPNVVMARQNLSMLVNNSTPTATAATGSSWGITLGGVPAVWRTGLGIDAHGNLMYVAAASQTAASLAQILIQMGAVRGMQLDINPAWPIFVTYAGPNAVGPSLFVPNPQQTASRFLVSSTKDFFAVFQRVPGMVQQPW